jgi:hypothetical protein
MYQVHNEHMRILACRCGSSVSVRRDDWKQDHHPLRRGAYKSSGRKPVLFPISASMTGPISSLSCHAKRYWGHPARRNVRCDPDVRTTLHPMR